MNVWRPTQRATAGHPQACARQTECWRNSFYQATGRPLWNAANIYVPTLVIGGDFDTWSFQEDREGLMRALVHAPTKRNVLIKDATHFVLFEKNRNQFFEEILKFMKE